jgi:hypothetical protein
MGLALKQTTTIGKHIVQYTANVTDTIKAYKTLKFKNHADDAELFFFVRDGEVLYSMLIEAACGQTSGYIESVTFNPEL